MPAMREVERRAGCASTPRCSDPGRASACSGRRACGTQPRRAAGRFLRRSGALGGCALEDALMPRRRGSCLPAAPDRAVRSAGGRSCFSSSIPGGRSADAARCSRMSSLVDAAKPTPIRRVDGRPERDGLAVHGPAGGDDEVRERDQALGRRRALGDHHRRQRQARARTSRWACGAGQDDGVDAVVRGRGARGPAGRAGSTCGDRATRRAAGARRRSPSPCRCRGGPSSERSGSKSAR